jgi:hypothetical protein
MDEDMLNLIGLLYSNADTDTVHAWLNKNLLIFVPSDGKRIQEYFG